MKSKEEREWIQKIENKEDRILLSNILENYHRFQKTSIPVSSDFLNERELELVKNALSYWKIPYSAYRPTEASERFIIQFGEDDFLTFYRIKVQALRHADVLGALFGCGFSPNMIGDIFIQEDAIYITNLKKYDRLLQQEFRQIGRVSITLEMVEKLPQILRSYTDIWLTASSPRLDLILSKLIKKSRSQTEEYQKSKRVLVNYQSISKVYFLKEQDILSVEGIGKFIVREIQEKKNGKLRILIQKYK